MNDIVPQETDAPEHGVLRTTSAGEVFVPAESPFAVHLAKKKSHDPAVHYFMEKHRDHLYPFFDIGAHVGIFSIIAARGGPVYSFEPDASNRILLAANLARFGLSVTVMPVAVAAQDGVIRMAPMTCGLSQGAVPTSRPEDVIELPARSLASFAEETGVVPGFIKIDVEGGELGVVEGMGAALAQSIIEVEFSWRDHGKSLDRFLAVRPIEKYDWTVALTKEDGEQLDRDVSPINFMDCGLVEYTMSNRDDLDAVCALLADLTVVRRSRKWEICITPKV